MGCQRVVKCLLQITRIVLAQLMISLDQPNRRMLARMSGGVGGGLSDEAPYPGIGVKLSGSFFQRVT